MPRVRYLAAFGLVCLAGCASGVSTVEEMDTAMNEVLAQGLDAPRDGKPAGKSTVGLSKGFSNALHEAVLVNDGYITAQAYEEEALAGVKIAKSARRVQTGANLTVGGIREGSPVLETSVGGSGDVSISQLVYDGGAAGGGINRATAAAIAARSDRLDRSNLIALEAGRAWIDTWQANERLALLRHKTRDLDDLMGQMDRMVANGMIDRATVDNAKRQLLDIKLEQTGLEATRAEAAVRFEQYFKQPADGIARPAEIVKPAVARARAVEWENAPALKRSVAEIFAAKGAAQEAKSAFKPRVSLQAGVTSPMDPGDTTDVSAGLRLQYVFNDGGRRKSQLEAAEKRVLALEAQFAEIQRGTKAEINGALVRLSALETSMPLVDEKVKLAASEAEVARSQIATGQANLRQLISAEIENYRACDQQIQMQSERLILLLTIAARTGYLTDVIGLKP